MPFNIPNTDDIDWSVPLRNHLAQLNDPDTGGFNEWLVSPLTGVDGLPLGPQHKGYTGFNKTKLLFETWDGYKWVDYQQSSNIAISTTTDINLDLSNPFTFSVTSTGIPQGWGWDTLINSNKPFDIHEENGGVFYTADKKIAFGIRQGLWDGFLLSSTVAIAGGLTSYIGQTFTVYKPIPNNITNPSLSYLISDTKPSGAWVTLASSVVNNLSDFLADNSVSGYTSLSFRVDATTYSNLLAISNTYTSFSVLLVFPTEKVSYKILIDKDKSFLGSNTISGAFWAPFPNANKDLVSSLFVKPLSNGYIKHQPRDERTFSYWTPFSILHTDRSVNTTFSERVTLTLATAKGNPNNKVVPLSLISDGGWGRCAFDCYRGFGTAGGDSGIEFITQSYTSFYPNQTGLAYVLTPRMFLNFNGNLGLGDNLRGPVSKLQVIGNIQASGTITANSTASDIRLKDNKQPLPSVWSTLKEITPFSFTWKKDFVIRERIPETINLDGSLKQEEPEVISDYLPDGIFISYSAQDIEKYIYPEAVIEDGYGIKHLRLEALVPFLHKSLIEVEETFNTRIDNLLQEINSLKARIIKLENTK